MPELNQDFKLDILKEVGNIGAGNATTSLSQLLNYQRVDMYVPEVDLCPLDEIPDLLGGAEKPVQGVFIKAPGDISFYTVFLMGEESAQSLVTNLTGREHSLDGEMGRSVLLEVGNIVTAAYLNALSYMTDLTFLPEPPQLAVDMAGAILGTVLAEANVAEDYILVLKTAFSTDSGDIDGNFLIIPDIDALDTVVKLLIDGVAK
ncbi:chemotaxis protein CheC [Dethiobacter alkaliphilus]|uniref:CheC, inhibitor of MCP methylation n=1 Tax=Dethiobacter alkaliphilus AHT 1 TaxID=555088 RepID=C0GJE5_DETAL|nr:chemotaxis protein CheC [Dethiobacter alkaliphilus]EEG76492.1 CheC, inhibitor of MCP methylation [Dethiobacter alkaliphilus AHT 1]